MLLAFLSTVFPLADLEEASPLVSLELRPEAPLVSLDFGSLLVPAAVLVEGVSWSSLATLLLLGLSSEK